MAGLVPAIHVFLPPRKAWMAATSAAMKDFALAIARQDGELTTAHRKQFDAGGSLPRRK
jgi:hypothetical protein